MVDKKIQDWELVSTELYESLSLRRRFAVTAFTENKALIEFACEEDRNELLEAQEVYLKNCTLTSKRWSPGSGTLAPDFLNIKERWVIMRGIPFHLWPSETFERLCSGFGKFIKVEVINSFGGSVISLRMLVRDCNPRLMNSVIRLFDGVLAYLVWIALEEIIGIEQSIPIWRNSEMIRWAGPWEHMFQTHFLQKQDRLGLVSLEVLSISVVQCLVNDKVPQSSEEVDVQGEKIEAANENMVLDEWDEITSSDEEDCIDSDG